MRHIYIPRFVIVDEDEISNDLCHALIRDVSIESEVYTFHHPMHCLELINNTLYTENHTPTILLLDMNTGDQSAWDFVKKFDLLDARVKRQTKFYLLSSSPNAQDIARAKENVDIIDFIIKPLDLSRILCIYFTHRYLSTQSQEALMDANIEFDKKLAECLTKEKTAYRELEAFSYSISHDLRAPLRYIDGYARILEEDYAHIMDSKAKQAISNVRRNTKKMEQLINGLLSLARYGRLAVSPKDIDMEDLAQRIVAESVGHERERTIKVHIGELPRVSGDPVMIAQVWANLIGNAIKYTSKRDIARIGIGAKEADQEICYYVRDNGAGFDQHFADKLFGVFQRLHSFEAFEGTGIGLATCKKMINRHGGRIWAEGRANVGATFYFSLSKKNDSIHKNDITVKTQINSNHDVASN